MITRREILKMLGLAPILPALAAIPTKGRSEIGGDVPLSMIFGEKETAGSFVYQGSWGRVGEVQNTYLTRVYVISDYPAHDRMIMLRNAEEENT